MTAAAPGHDTRPVRAAAAERRVWVEMVMGLPVSVTVRGPGARADATDHVVQGLFAELRQVDRVFSTWRPDSEIGRLRAGTLPRQLISPQVREVLDLCEQARALTGGLFDATPCAGPPRDRSGLPDDLRHLDPSGLVKGWAVERAAAALHALPAVDWLVNAGGDIQARATHGPAWRVAIEDPRDARAVLCVLPLATGALATSGTAARGRHIMDPRTGAPAADRVLSATVTGPGLTWVDVRATAAFVEGPAALSRIAALPGHEALLVMPDGHLIGTPGSAAVLQAGSS